MILMSLISSVVIVSCNSLPVVTSSEISSGSSSYSDALTADPHAGTQSDTPSHEKPATKDPVIESEGGRRTYYEGDTAVLDCIVRDLGDHAKIWLIGQAHLHHLLFAGPQVIMKNPRMSQIGEQRSLQITDLTVNDTETYICQVAHKNNPTIKFDVKVLPASHRETATTGSHGGRGSHGSKHPYAKSNSISSLNPSAVSAVTYNTVTGIALISLFFNNYFVRQA